MPGDTQVPVPPSLKASLVGLGNATIPQLALFDVMRKQAMNNLALERALAPLREHAKAISQQIAETFQSDEDFSPSALLRAPDVAVLDGGAVEAIADLNEERQAREMRMEQALLAIGENLARTGEVQAGTLRELRAQGRRGWWQAGVFAVVAATLAVAGDLLIRTL